MSRLAIPAPAIGAAISLGRAVAGIALLSALLTQAASFAGMCMAARSQSGDPPFAIEANVAPKMRAQILAIDALGRAPGEWGTYSETPDTQVLSKGGASLLIPGWDSGIVRNYSDARLSIGSDGPVIVLDSPFLACGRNLEFGRATKSLSVRAEYRFASTDGWKPYDESFRCGPTKGKERMMIRFSTPDA